jgi:hypothetical protein
LCKPTTGCCGHSSRRGALLAVARCAEEPPTLRRVISSPRLAARGAACLCTPHRGGVPARGLRSGAVGRAGGWRAAVRVENPPITRKRMERNTVPFITFRRNGGGVFLLKVMKGTVLCSMRFLVIGGFSTRTAARRPPALPTAPDLTPCAGTPPPCGACTSRQPPGNQASEGFGRRRAGGSPARRPAARLSSATPTCGACTSGRASGGQTSEGFTHWRAGGSLARRPTARGAPSPAMPLCGQPGAYTSRGFTR